jgi:hypothetical protein
VEVLVFGKTCFLERIGEEPPVVLLPAVGRGGVGEQHPDAALTVTTGCLATVVIVVAAACGDEAEHGQYGEGSPHAFAAVHACSPSRITCCRGR